MPTPDDLYEVHPEIDVPAGLHLVAGLTGFSDAGGAVGQLNDHLNEMLDTTVVAEFDADILLDYRARRPIISFDQDHLTEYRPPRLTLSLARDELGSPFLLLTGFEPDFLWGRFVAAVLDLVERFQVSDTTWVHSIPMPVPHTRPIGVTVSGNRFDLIESLSVWRPHTQVPSNVLHLLEYRLYERGDSVAGFVLLVPHYLADTEFPSAAIASIESLSAATGLIFPTDRLREEGRDFIGKIDEQLGTNHELGKLVSTLEERYDAYMADNTPRSPLTDIDGELPSADEIAAELEKFLASRRHGDDDRSST
ncbi:PAC2 family protein [Plantibacter flavus]|uniref:proteasome assembly chaperone family protein n=1 Tax=Plantibacter flavus TaxID=150123 RepID=UPI003F186423